MSSLSGCHSNFADHFCSSVYMVSEVKHHLLTSSTLLLLGNSYHQLTLWRIGIAELLNNASAFLSNILLITLVNGMFSGSSKEHGQPKYSLVFFSRPTLKCPLSWAFCPFSPWSSQWIWYPFHLLLIVFSSKFQYPYQIQYPYPIWTRSVF